MTGHPSTASHHRSHGKLKPYLKRKHKSRGLTPGLLAYVAQRLRDLADELEALDESPAPHK